MPTVLVTRPTVTQNSPFSSLAAAITNAGTHYVYPGGVDLGGLVKYWDGIQRMVTHLSTNPAQLRVTLYPTTSPLSQTAKLSVSTPLTLLCHHTVSQKTSHFMFIHNWHMCQDQPIFTLCRTVDTVYTTQNLQQWQFWTLKVPLMGTASSPSFITFHWLLLLHYFHVLSQTMFYRRLPDLSV